MSERPHETEALLQALLADHLGILVDDERDGECRGWVLTKREAGVADAEGAGDGGRWITCFSIQQVAVSLMVFLLVGVAGWRRRADTNSNPVIVVLSLALAGIAARILRRQHPADRA